MKDFKKTLNKDIKDFKKLDIESKLYVVFFFIIIIIAAVVTGNSFPGNAQTTQEVTSLEVEMTDEKTTSTLSLSPSSGDFKVGDEIPVSVVLSNNPVSAVDIVLTYDPAVFSLSEVRNGTAFPKLVTQKIEEGKLTVSTSLDPAGSKDPQTGEIFSFTLKALAQADGSVVEFDREGTISAIDGKNVLGLTVGGSYSVTQ